MPLDFQPKILKKVNLHFDVSKAKGDGDRIVIVAAAKFKGKSLNDAIISGPALQNSLPTVIIRFREGEIAWSADI